MSTTAAVAGKIQPRLKQKYNSEIKKALQEEFGYANVMQIPGLVKVVVNTGVGEAARDSKVIDGAVDDLTKITGQKPVVTKHVKVGQTQRGTKTGGLETVEAPIHISNVALVDPSTKKPTKVGHRVEEQTKDGVKRTVRVRFAKKSGKDL